VTVSSTEEAALAGRHPAQAPEIAPERDPVPKAPAAIQELQGETREAAEEPPAATILIADVAYRSRVEAERAGEPALAPERAYVVAELDDHDALTQALSVAQESHLVTLPPDRLTADLQAIHAREIAASMEAAEAQAAPVAEAELAAAAARSRELAIEAALEQAQAQRQAERQAERDIGGLGHRGGG
jgi:hypothetical protein